MAQGQDWAIVNLPCELFVEHGITIAESSPFRHTALNTLANGHCGYLPTVEVTAFLSLRFSRGSYLTFQLLISKP